MERDDIKHHISNRFNVELMTIVNNVSSMGIVVKEQLQHTMQALLEHNHEIANRVISRDTEINRLQMIIDNECNQTIARYQPTAVDLRVIIASTRIVNDLERIGDQAKHISKKILNHSELNASLPGVHQGLINLSNEALSGLDSALNTYKSMDTQQAIDVVRHDELIDEHYSEVVTKLNQLALDAPEHVAVIIDLMWVAYALERIGDHARNIGEAAIYMVEGKDIRHERASDISASLT
ncbi:phosphate transport system regulatory protein PhoU [Ectothiorhodospiraceae bacterium BW-2]|nr:phosphate transport system regulatory protein PhoU [Ectothiorhodospiraceae bacterium BW-2]